MEGIKIADYLGYERAFKRAGLKYTIEPGAWNRGHGDLAEVRFIVLHHTAGGSDDGDIRVVRDGRAGLPGPLSQLVLKKDGTVHLVAVGVCWQAPGNISYRGVKAGSGNWYSLGIEGVSSGVRDDWTKEQREVYPKLVAALLFDMGLPHDAWIRHQDYQPGEKIDPAFLTKDWFAPRIKAEYDKLKNPVPEAPKETAIQAKYKQAGWLGKPVTESEELPTPDGVGRFRYYENGSIYWTPATGACALSNEMVEKYRELDFELGMLKYPTSDVFDVKGGRCQRFQGGTLYYNDALKKTFSVYGRIGAEWASWNWENGFLGLPVEDPVNFAVGAKQDYTGGSIWWSNKTDAHAVYGLIGDKFKAGGIDEYGFPLKAEGDTQDSGGRFQNFEFATIYYKWGTDEAFAVKDRILKAYKLLGFEVGKLGYPVTDEKEVNLTAVRQSFEHGFIEVDKLTGDTEIMIDGESMKV